MSDTISRRDAFNVLDNCRFASEQEKKYAYSLMEQVASADVKDTNDMINRQAALDCFHDWIDKYGNVCTPDDMPEYRAIEALPSVQPEWEELLVICDVCGHAIRVKRH